jgi:peptidoglycan/LPS O-acetylase OafA/YrhL
MRRARRLLPALFVMLAAYGCVIAARGGNAARSVVLGGLYIGNVVQASGDVAIHDGALRHLWSLAEEE